MDKKIGVMIIDDSAVVRGTLTELISTVSDIYVMDTASDPYIAAKKLQQKVPDVIILDIEMPRMDGLTFLKKLMSQHPLPVIICSSKTEDGSQNAIQALEFGAVDIIRKPKIGTREFIKESGLLICDTIRAARLSTIKKHTPAAAIDVSPKLTADVMLPKPGPAVHIDTTENVIVVGASTGGTEALMQFLKLLPLDAPAVVIVQHMPEHFTAAFARRLDGICTVTVKEAENNDSVLRGRALIAPGNKHILLKRSGARYYVEVKDGPLVCRHRPSVDVLFRSTARYVGKNAIGVIMTGMGDDGSRGMLEMKNSGAYTIAQDEESSVVFGMPKEAIKLGCIDSILPLMKIAGMVINKGKN